VPTHYANYIQEKTPTIHMISERIASRGDSNRKWRRYTDDLSKGKVFKIEKHFSRFDTPIAFSSVDFGLTRFPLDDALVLALKMKPTTEGSSRRVKRVLIDTGNSVDIMYKSTFDQIGLLVMDLSPMLTPLISFSGDTLYSLGIILLEVQFRSQSCSLTLKLTFLVVETSSAYNAILGREALNKLGVVVSTSHLMIKFPMLNGIGCEQGDQKLARSYYSVVVRGVSHVVQVD
jgi:hypothetical protein